MENPTAEVVIIATPRAARKEPHPGCYTRTLIDTVSSPSEAQPHQQHRDSFTRLGGWLFRHRSLLPLPLVALLLSFPPSGPWGVVAWAGVALVALGEAGRLWAVHHIGVISRTRADRLGPLVASGPFAWVRNPLYLGNIALWTGFALSARLAWMAPVIIALLALEYSAIVRWEEDLLASRLGSAYRQYAARVPRWIPRPPARPGEEPHDVQRSLTSPGGSIRCTLFSERGTLVAIGAGYVLLWLKDVL
jgi:protein-S-isoprenylcysteine O-methyltransferase Ste14